MQNLPQNHLPDLAEARGLVSCGNFEGVELLYEDVPDTLSQLIRTAFVPKPGYKFIVSDFSAIEARVLAWFAGEIWRQEVFESKPLVESVVLIIAVQIDRASGRFQENADRSSLGSFRLLHR